VREPVWQENLLDPAGIPLQRDPESGEESPYLRRQRALLVRRRISFRLRWMAYTAAILLSLGLSTYFLVSFALASPEFALTSFGDVMVEGNRYVSRQEICYALGFVNGLHVSRNIFTLPLAEKQKQVESIPWVRSATLVRTFPRSIVIHVLERVPVAFVNTGGHLKLVDSEGVILEAPEKTDFDFPVLQGLEKLDELSEREQRVDLYLQFQAEVGPEIAHSGWLVSEIDVSDADDLNVLLVRGRENIRLHFGNQQFLSRWRNFLALLPEIRKSDAGVDSVDLRYRDQIVVSPRTTVGRDE